MTTQQHDDDRPGLSLGKAWAVVLGFLTLILVVIPWLIATAPLAVLGIAAVLTVIAFRPPRW